MNLALISIAQKALQNKHTTGAAIVYAVAKFGCPLVQVWMPAYKSQLDTTATILEGAAVFYGFAAAGDGSQSYKAHEETKALVGDLQNQINSVKSDTETIKKQP